MKTASPWTRKNDRNTSHRPADPVAARLAAMLDEAKSGAEPDGDHTRSTWSHTRREEHFRLPEGVSEVADGIYCGPVRSLRAMIDTFHVRFAISCLTEAEEDAAAVAEREGERFHRNPTDGGAPREAVEPLWERTGFSPHRQMAESGDAPMRADGGGRTDADAHHQRAALCDGRLVSVCRAPFEDSLTADMLKPLATAKEFVDNVWKPSVQEAAEQVLGHMEGLVEDRGPVQEPTEDRGGTSTHQASSPAAARALYICCRAGRSRSPAIAIALLMHLEPDTTLADCFEQLPNARPNPNFVWQLMGLEVGRRAAAGVSAAGGPTILRAATTLNTDAYFTTWLSDCFPFVDQNELTEALKTADGDPLAARAALLQHAAKAEFLRRRQEITVDNLCKSFPAFDEGVVRQALSDHGGSRDATVDYLMSEARRISVTQASLTTRPDGADEDDE